MENFTEDYLDIHIEDGIVHIVMICEHYTAQMVEAGIKQRLALTKDKSYPIFADMRKVKRFPREAQQRLAQKDAAFGTKAAAILIKSKVHVIIYNFFCVCFRAPAPSKIFTNKDKAIAWLQQFK